MQWDRLFEDLEGQLASEWEAERAILDAESERLRISRLELRARLRVLCGDAAVATLHLPGGRRVRSRLHTLGADWLAVEPSEATRATRGRYLVPLSAIRGIDCDHGVLLGSLDVAAEQRAPLRERMTLGFVLRDLARRRLPVRMVTADGDDLHGTVDRAGHDHLDLALHDAGTARVAAAVRGYRIVPFGAVVSLWVGEAQIP